MAVNAYSGTPLLPEDSTQTSSATTGSLVRYVQLASMASNQKRLKRERLSPPAALGLWLDMDSNQERDLFWFNMKKYVSPSSLPNILLEYLQRTKCSVVVSSISFQTYN